MNLKLFHNIALSKSIKSNIIYLYNYICEDCKFSDNYICLELDDVTICAKCGTLIYFRELENNKGKLLMKIEIGKIRSEEEHNLHVDNEQKEFYLKLKNLYAKEE